jgi:hypothetical protein
MLHDGSAGTNYDNMACTGRLARGLCERHRLIVLPGIMGGVNGASDTFSPCSGANVSAIAPLVDASVTHAHGQMNAYLDQSYDGAAGCLENYPGRYYLALACADGGFRAGFDADNLTAQTQRCGNGVLDPLEDCDDSGGLFGPKDPCCDSKSCKLLPGCACAAGQAGVQRPVHVPADALPDLLYQRASGSQWHGESRPAGPTDTCKKVCRSSRGFCDVQETCDGVVADCPPDGVRVSPAPLVKLLNVVQRTGESCNPNGTCHRGQCIPSAADQQETVCQTKHGRAAGACPSVCDVLWCTPRGGGLHLTPSTGQVRGPRGLHHLLRLRRPGHGVRSRLDAITRAVAPTSLCLRCVLTNLSQAGHVNCAQTCASRNSP